MMRGTFANIRIKNQMVPGVEGGVTMHYPSGEQHADLRRGDALPGSEGVPLVVFAGKEYGTGSSRDWAAKGTRLLGVRAVIAESFERIHRSNLVGMGVLPLHVRRGHDAGRRSGSRATRRVDLAGLARHQADAVAGGGHRLRRRRDARRAGARRAIDTLDELDYFRNGGILHYVLRSLAADAA